MDDDEEEERRLAAEIAAMEAEELELAAQGVEDDDGVDEAGEAGYTEGLTENPLADRGALTYTTSRGTSGIVE